MRKEITSFDKTDQMEEIKKQIDELIRRCTRERIPIFISACYKNTPKDSLYYNNMVGTVSNGIVLKKDYFPHYVNIQNGFQTIPPREMDEINMEDVVMPDAEG